MVEMHTRHWVVILLGALGTATMVTSNLAGPAEVDQAHALQSQLVAYSSLAISAIMGGIDQAKGIWQIIRSNPASAPSATALTPEEIAKLRSSLIK